MVERSAGHPSPLRRPEHVDAIDRRPVRLAPLDAARDDDEVFPGGGDALVNAAEERLRQQSHVARRGIDELALGVHHVLRRAVEPTDHEDLSIRECDGARVRTRLRELSDRLPVGVVAGTVRAPHAVMRTTTASARSCLTGLGE